MVMDALRGYVQLANGLTEVTRQRAQQAAKALLQQTGAEPLAKDLTTRVTDLADEIVATSKSNRALLQAIIGNEVEGAVARLGFVRAEEVDALTRRIDALEREAEQAKAAPAAEPAPVKKAAVKKAPVKKAAVKKAPAKKAAKKATAKAPVKKAAKKTAARKSAGSRA
jgi:polyhydroxyalkanoate synthesis regulator phasin